MKKILCMLMALICLLSTMVFTPMITSASVPGAEYTYTVFSEDFENYVNKSNQPVADGEQFVNSDEFYKSFEMGDNKEGDLYTGNKREMGLDPKNSSNKTFKYYNNNENNAETMAPMKSYNKFRINKNKAIHIRDSGIYEDTHKKWKKVWLEYNFYPTENTATHTHKLAFEMYLNWGDDSTGKKIELGYLNSNQTIGVSKDAAVKPDESNKYKFNDWNKLAFEISISDKVGGNYTYSYNIYLNGILADTGSVQSSYLGISRMGFSDYGFLTPAIYFDDISYKISPFLYNSSSISGGSNGIQTKDKITLSFSKSPNTDYESFIELTATNTNLELNDTPAPFTTSLNGNDIIIDVTGGMKFETDYKLTVKKGMSTSADNTTLADYGQVNDIVISFKTMGEGAVTTMPHTSDTLVDSSITAASAVYNYKATSVTVKMYGGIYDSQGIQKKLFHGDAITLDAKSGDTVDTDTITVTVTESGLEDSLENYTVKFFPVDFTEMQLLRKDWLTMNPTLSQVASPASLAAGEIPLSLQEPVPPDTNGRASISGSYTSGGSVLVYLKDTSDNVVYATPVISDSNGNFTVNYNLAAGRYTVHASAYGQSGTVSCIGKLIYIDNARKEQIKNSINSAADINALKDVFEDPVTGCKEEIMLADSVYTDSAYQLLFEQKPYISLDGTDGIKEKLVEFSSILPNINNADWVTLKSMLSGCGDVILNSASSYTTYTDLIDDDGKSRVCQLAINDNGFLTIDDFRSYFAGAITAYYGELALIGQGGNNKGNTYLGGSGGGGAPAPVVPNIPTPEIPPQPTEDFTDLAGYDWAKPAIYALRDAGIISADSLYRPGEAIKREEYVKLIVMLMGINVSGADASFDDVDISAWYAPYLKAAKDAGIITGQGNNTFGIGQQISRQDMMVMAYRALVNLGKSVSAEPGELNFTDAEDISDYARDIIAAMHKLGIINGKGDGTIAPLDSATRAEAAKIIYGLLSLI